MTNFIQRIASFPVVSFASLFFLINESMKMFLQYFRDISAFYNI